MRTHLVLFSIFIFINTLRASPFSLPILAWSPNPSSFPSKEIFNTITPEIFESSLKSLVQGASSTLFSSSSNEVVVLFVEPQLRTDQVTQNAGKFQNIQSSMLGSSSTLFAPYGTTSSQQTFVTDAFLRLSREDHVILVTQNEFISHEGLTAVQINDLENFFNTHESIFSNGVADLIVVSFDNEEDVLTHDELVGTVISAVQSHTQKYVAIYTANSPTSSNIKLSFPQVKEYATQQSHYVYPTESLYEYTIANVTNCSVPIEVIQHNFFNGPMLEVYLVSIILVFIITTGLCCMCELQTPQGFENGKASKFKLL